MSERRKAREIAVQTLYEMTQRGVSWERPLADNMERRGGGPEVQAYAERLLRAVQDHREEITERLRGALRNWTLERVALVDRCILELGSAELLHFEDVPLGVVINEAVEIARKFSTEESGAFVNGILDRIAHSQPKSSSEEPG